VRQNTFNEMSDQLEELIIELEDEEQKLIDCGKKMLNEYGLTDFTIFSTSILNRTLNLNRGYVSLINSNNYIAAAPLVRLNLDSLLRLFASTQSEYTINEFCKKVREGESIRKMNYFKNKKIKLRDNELVKLIKNIKGCKWTKDVYETGSGFIHLSHQHIYSSIKFEKNRISGGILKTDNIVPTAEKEAGTYYMIKGSKCIRFFVDDLISAKKSTLPNNSNRCASQ
ncbi:hypothetical protein RM553_19550, partial [Zunongwangia sp. F363]